MDLARPATWDDVAYVYKNMRQEDQDECWAGGLNPDLALSMSHEGSIVSYALISPDTKKPAALLGISPSNLGPRFGIIWMLGTDDIKKHRFTFLRNCKPFLGQLYEATEKECFYNYTYSKNSLHHDWLKWLGFSFLREVQLPPTNEPFYEFVRLKG
jgi:hypothetical protein